MSDTMLHRVARAIMEAGTGCEVTDWREAEWNPHIAQVLKEASAAIEAMRDPHPLQLYPGAHAYIEVDGTCRPVAFRAGWNAVIDAALSQDTHSLPSEDR